jgi:hypothetical protein
MDYRPDVPLVVGFGPSEPLLTEYQWLEGAIAMIDVLKKVIFGCVVASAVGIVAHAQWLKVTLPDTPRSPDGTPNLSAPSPRTPDGKPDLSGIWRINLQSALQRRDAMAKFPNGPTHLEWLMPTADEIPFLPSARALYKEREDQFGKGSPTSHCLPHGIDAMIFTFMKVVQNARLTLILLEEFNHYRQIFTDGRTFPLDPQPTWFGYSVGKWDGEAFVVETAGFNDQSWMDDAGLPHSDALRTTERFARRDFGHLQVGITFTDPKSYSQPWSVTLPFDLQADTELLEHLCDNERDSARLVEK